MLKAGANRMAYAFILTRHISTIEITKESINECLAYPPGLQINMLAHVIAGQSFDDQPIYFSFKEAGMS